MTSATPNESKTMPAAASSVPRSSGVAPSAARETDWRQVAYLLHASRALDEIEESRLLPERQVLYQFSARGHDFAQILLGLQLTDPHDGVTVYYRSRPVMLALGVELEEAAAGPLARAGSFSGGRDIGVVFNKPARGGATVLPASGGVGAQYTPAAGWAQAIRYHHEALQEADYARSISTVLGGDAIAPADAVLYRGQRLRHFGAIAAADPGGQHCGQPALVLRPDIARRRRRRSAGGHAARGRSGPT